MPEIQASSSIEVGDDSKSVGPAEYVGGEWSKASAAALFELEAYIAEGAERFEKAFTLYY
jgi:hypothetical protein